MSANLFVCRVCGAVANRAEARSWAVQGHGKAVCPECRVELNAKTRSGRSESSNKRHYQTHPYDSTFLPARQGWTQKSRRQRARWRVR